MKKMITLAAMIMSLNVFAYDYNEVVVCDYMATLVQTEEGSNNVFFVNALLVSDKDLHTGFAYAQNIPLNKVNGAYVLSYPTKTGSVELQITKDSYTITEDFNGEKLVEVRKCLINNLPY
ncbi:hypothetical protein SHI21_04805 [Bacteriovorax sp. PP10]|uniref:Uncharacterized protein n=1 Tax=Bacteriovorax antarcticus TaxID=3088717 RepID=A0ABU5VR41_9BACT|nr:hypothetical protein [Bacteriovorax sp. PP10]MEA9355504.1 hypothetical protein [Bacteriovorax sp. PP10]